MSFKEVEKEEQISIF